MSIQDTTDQQAAKTSGKWQKTKHANIRRYVPSGIYHIHAKVGGQLIRGSLDTDSITVAVVRRDDKLRRERKTLQTQQEVAKGRMTVGDALKMFKERIQNDAGLKPKTKAYYDERLTALLKSWKELPALDIRKVSETNVKEWAKTFKASPTAYNHTISILRHVLAIGVEVGARYDNPATCLKRVRERPKVLSLPSVKEFNSFVESIRNSGSGHSKPCANLVQFLAFGGFRISEAKNITWGDVDFDKGHVRVLGDEEHGTKNGEFRFVPMIQDMRTLLERLKTEDAEAKSSSPVMKVHECQRSMDRAAKEVGIKRITHHDLRHLFATRCIEKEVDIPTVSKWLGHKDGGALAMRVYGHLRQEHSENMAKKVSFS
jgi:integrase